MTEIEKIAEIICDNVEYGFAFSDLSEGGFMRNKYINAATAILDYQKGKRDEEIKVRISECDALVDAWFDERSASGGN